MIDIRYVIAANSTTIPQGCQETVCNPQINTPNNRLIGYGFDASGNTTTDANGQTITYYAENKQTEARDSSNVVIGEYFYDGDGKRVKKIVPSTGETTVFVYDAGGKLVAEYSNQISQTPQIAYLTADMLGTPRINTDSVGNVITRHDYLPFGEEITGTAARTLILGYGSDDIRKKFTGFERDNETDLDFAQARYFNSDLGRFSSPDYFGNDTSTVAPQSWNLYSYGRNNPLLYVDRSGKELYVVVNGNSYQVTRSDGTYKVEGNDGSNPTLKATEGFVNRLVENFGSELRNLVDSKDFKSFIEVGDSGGNIGGTTWQVVCDCVQTTSEVNISASDPDESFVAFATEAIMAYTLVGKNDIWLSYRQNSKDGSVDLGKLDVNYTVWQEFARMHYNFEYQVRIRYNINPIPRLVFPLDLAEVQRKLDAVDKVKPGPDNSTPPQGFGMPEPKEGQSGSEGNVPRPTPTPDDPPPPPRRIP